MASQLNQHKALAMGKSLSSSPSPIAKFKKGGVVKLSTFEKTKKDVELPGMKEGPVKEEKYDKKQAMPFKKGGKVCK